jgi:hypothetical protein
LLWGLGHCGVAVGEYGHVLEWNGLVACVGRGVVVAASNEQRELGAADKLLKPLATLNFELIFLSYYISIVYVRCISFSLVDVVVRVQNGNDLPPLCPDHQRPWCPFRPTKQPVNQGVTIL